MFEKSLTDLVKGIRSNKNNEEPFIRACMQEIRTELKSADMKKKAAAVQKLTYLHMIGYNMIDEDTTFNIIEVMSQPKFSFKRVGYLAAAQTFTTDAKVVMLATQLLRKDLKSGNQYETGLAISGLSTFCTPDLARDLVSDVVSLMNSQKPYIRKKAVLVMFKIFLQYPDALMPSFPKIKEKLADNHPSVVACSVNVVCELARKNPKNYLGMAPIFFKLMTSLNNNWTVIKIVKLMGALSPHEPRLAKKLVEPMANMINTTPAKSLLYECLHTVTIGMQKHVSIVKLAVEKLKMFVQDPDQNLKYLGLLGLGNLLSEYPKIISDLKDVILDCLEDEDITIRHRALDLLTGVANKKNINSIINRLLKYTQDADGDYRNHLVEKIIGTCSKDIYSNVSNFRWYLQVLIDLTELKGIEHGKLIASQFMDVLIRVKSVRAYGVSEMVKLLNSPHIMNESSQTSNIFEVLYAAAWLVGEFLNESEEEPRTVLESLLQAPIATLPPNIQSCYVQSITKVYATVAGKAGKTEQAQQSGQNSLEMLGLGENTNETPTNQSEHLKKLHGMRTLIRNGFDQFLQTSNSEVQERVGSCLKLLEIHESLLETGMDIGSELLSLFEDPLNPVASGSQSRVPVPEGLNLDKWINEPFEVDIDEISEYWEPNQNGMEEEEDDGNHQEAHSSSSKSQQKSIYILKGNSQKNDPNIESKNLSELLGNKKTKKKTKKKPKKKQQVQIENVEISKVIEEPEGPVVNKSEDPIGNFSPSDKLASINVSELSGKETLYQPKAYPTAQEQLEAAQKKINAKNSTKKTGEKKKTSSTGTTGKKKANSGKKSNTKKTKPSEGKDKEEDLIDFLTSPTGQSKANNATTTTTGPSSDTKKAATSKAKKVKKGSRKKLCKDDSLSVSYHINVMPTDASHITIPIDFENTSSSPLSNLDFEIEGDLNIKMVRPREKPTGPLRASANLPVGGCQSLSVQFQFTAVTSPHKMEGYVEYALDGQKKRLKFTLVLSSSIFMLPKKLDTSELPKALQSIPLIASSKYNLPAKGGKIADFGAATTEIAKLLRLAIIQKQDNIASILYGVSIQNHTISVMVKSESDAVGVQIRGSSETLANSLLTEIHQFMKK